MLMIKSSIFENLVKRIERFISCDKHFALAHNGISLRELKGGSKEAGCIAINIKESRSEN